VAVVLALIQTKQITINIHKHPYNNDNNSIINIPRELNSFVAVARD